MDEEPRIAAGDHPMTRIMLKVTSVRATVLLPQAVPAPCHLARGLHLSQGPGHDMLAVRQHVVPAVLPRRRRLLSRGRQPLSQEHRAQ
jgi:hypothetical protein